MYSNDRNAPGNDGNITIYKHTHETNVLIIIANAEQLPNKIKLYKFSSYLTNGIAKTLTYYVFRQISTFECILLVFVGI